MGWTLSTTHDDVIKMEEFFSELHKRKEKLIKSVLFPIVMQANPLNNLFNGFVSHEYQLRCFIQKGK